MGAGSGGAGSGGLGGRSRGRGRWEPDGGRQVGGWLEWGGWGLDRGVGEAWLDRGVAWLGVGWVCWLTDWMRGGYVRQAGAR